MKIQKHPSTSMEYRVDAPRFPWISKIIEEGIVANAQFFFFFFFKLLFLIDEEVGANFTVLPKKIYSIENNIDIKYFLLGRRWETDFL